MRRIALLTVGLSILGQAALAADLRPPPPPPAPAAYKAPPVYFYSWTGCYIGGNGGGLWVRKNFALTTIVGVPVGVNDFGSHDASSGIGGVQLGCNYQFAGGWVIGIQGDYDWSNANGSHIEPATGFGTTITSETKSLGSVTGRLGYAWNRFLGYVKGGWAWERDNYSWIIPPIGPTAILTASETVSGWTVGIGGEYAFLDWLTGFIEYDYYDFGTRNIGFVPFAPITAANFDIRERKSVLKAGLNFKWGGGPVVASY